jgi:hypothetical protein
MMGRCTHGRLQGACRECNAEPIVGEMIYGCQCPGSHCGKVSAVVEHVTRDGMNHYLVAEDFHGRRVRARRELDGLLYEVELAPGMD